MFPFDAGVVDRPVEAAEAFHRDGHQRVHGGRIGHVGASEFGLPALCTDERDGFLAAFHVHVGHHHPGAFPRHHQGRGTTDAAAGSRDQSRSIQQFTTHGRFLLIL